MKKRSKNSPQKMKIKTNWDLSEYYASLSDPKIEKDLANITFVCENFRKKYEGKVKTHDPIALTKTLVDYLEVVKVISEASPLMYTMYIRSIDSTNQKAEALEKKAQDAFTKAVNQLTFLRVAIAKANKEEQKALLAHKPLAEYKHFLETIFKEGAHTLGVEAENVMSLKQQPAYSEWVSFVGNKLSGLKVKWEGKLIPMPQAEALLKILPTTKRYKLDKLIKEATKVLAPDVQAEMTAIVINKKISDELRNFTEPFQSRLLDDKISDATITTLREVVKKYQPISHKFYKLKAKILKLKKLKYVDRNTQMGSIKKKYSFEEGYQFVYESFLKADPEFAEVYKKSFEQGLVDVFPRMGKQGGAYCSSSYNHQTRVLLNHAESIDAIMTLAHEFGHAFHGHYSYKAQSVLYSGYSTATAEVASTFFENFVQERLFATLSDKEKTIALADSLQNSINTVFRQIAAFEMEYEIHQIVKKNGMITADELSATHNKHMQSYLGPIFSFEKDDGLMVFRWPHIRYFFYVYSYSFGELVSNALFARYQKDPSYLEKVKDFMRAGGNGTTEQIFQSVGIDVTSPKFFEDGLLLIKAKVDELERLLK